jgi:hypothetical protein
MDQRCWFWFEQSGGVDVTAAAQLDFIVSCGGKIDGDLHFADWQKFRSAERSTACAGTPRCAPSCPDPLCRDISGNHTHNHYTSPNG